MKHFDSSRASRLPSRAHAWKKKGDFSRARDDYQTALAAAPCSPTALNGLAWLLATAPEDSCRDGSRAVELATLACELTDWKSPYFIGTLAAACAEVRDFDAALTWQTKAIGLASEKDRAMFEQRIEAYKDRTPARDAM
jgi:Tfp pilus assembly protein PilF